MAHLQAAARCSGAVSTSRPLAPVRMVSGPRHVTVCALTAEKASLDLAKMSPINDRILIRPADDEQKTAGGILLPKGPPKAPSDAHIGEVVAVGSEVELPIAKGDHVVFQRYATAEVEVPEGTILFVAAKSIMAKLEQ